MILDLMQLESSFVSTDVSAVYCTRTYVREGINIFICFTVYFRPERNVIIFLLNC
jgi:hypothetical protein